MYILLAAFFSFLLTDVREIVYGWLRLGGESHETAGLKTGDGEGVGVGSLFRL